MIVAGQRIETVKRQTGGHSWAILMALCERDLNGARFGKKVCSGRSPRGAHERQAVSEARGGYEPLPTPTTRSERRPKRAA